MSGYFLHPLSLNGVDVNNFNVTTYATHDKDSSKPTKMDIGIGSTGFTRMGGLKVCAMASGKVLMAQLSGQGDGMVVISTALAPSIDDANLSIKKIRYVHLKADSIQVEVGDIVSKGQYLGDIAKAGEEGYGTAEGEHLHIDLSDDISESVDPTTMDLRKKENLISNYSEYVNSLKYDDLIDQVGSGLSHWNDSNNVVIPYLIMTEKAVFATSSGEYNEDFDIWTKASLDLDDEYTQKAFGVLYWEGLNRITSTMDYVNLSIENLSDYGLFAASEIMTRCLRNRAVNRFLVNGKISSKDVFDIANNWNPPTTFDSTKDLLGSYNSMPQVTKNFIKDILNGKFLNFPENFYIKYKDTTPSGWTYSAAKVNNNYPHDISKDLFLVTGFHADSSLPGVERDFNNNEILWVAPGVDYSRVIADTYSGTYSTLYDKYR
ncbi:MAG: M23 family metallopeptidase [Bacilli bacterium]